MFHILFCSSWCQSGKSGTIRESKQALGVRKAHYVKYYVEKSYIFLAGTGIRKIACGFSPTKIHFSDYPTSLITRVTVLAWFL